MKQKHTKRNSKRLSRIIRESYKEICNSVGWYGDYHFHYNIGMTIFSKIRMYKHDVICYVCNCRHRAITTFARGDIRHRNTFSEPFYSLIALLAFLFTIMLLFS